MAGERRLASGGWRAAAASVTAPLLERADRTAPTAPRLGYLVAPVIGARLMALMFRALWHRQLANTLLADASAQEVGARQL
jgi:hypothetical protein